MIVLSVCRSVSKIALERLNIFKCGLLHYVIDRVRNGVTEVTVKVTLACYHFKGNFTANQHHQYFWLPNNWCLHRRGQRSKIKICGIISKEISISLTLILYILLQRFISPKNELMMMAILAILKVCNSFSSSWLESQFFFTDIPVWFSFHAIQCNFIPCGW